METNSKYFLEKNFLVYLGGRGVSAIMSVLSIPLFIRLFGTEEYGKFILNYSIFLMALSLSNGWVNQGLIRFFYKWENKACFVEKLRLLTITSSILVGMVLVVIFFLRDEPFLFIFLIFITFILGGLYLFKSVEYQSRMKPKKAMAGEIIRLFFFIFTPWIIKDIDFFGVGTKIFLGVFLGYLFGLFYLIGLKSVRHLTFTGYIANDSKLYKTIAIYGMPLSVWMVFSPTTNGVDRYLIEYYLGAIALGQYTAVYDIVFKVFSQLAIPLNSIVQPLLMYAYNKQEQHVFKKTLFKAGMYLSIIFISLFSIFQFFKEFILVEYLGFENEMVLEKLNLIFAPLIISSFVWQIAILLQKKLEAQNRTLLMAFLMVISIIISIVFSLWLVPIYGIIASAYIMLMTSVLYLILIIITNLRK